MSEKRSDRLRSIIAATVTDAAEDAAPVTVTGSGITPSDQRDYTSRTAPLRRALPLSSESGQLQAQDQFNALERGYEHPASANPTAQPRSVLLPTPIAPSTRAGLTDVNDSRSAVRPALRAPERPTKIRTWEKANVTLEPRDLAILRRSDAQARAYGFRIRKGGNPSLFVRAALRLLDELIDRDPEGWIKRIAATTPATADALTETT